jgi:flagellin
MAMRIAHNIPAMTTHRWLGVSDAGLTKSLERLSSGYRINRASDDAAGLAVSQRFRAEIASLKVASRNTSEATAALQVAEGATDQIANILTRLKELATQAASGNSGKDRDKLDDEAQKLMAELQDIATSTQYAGQNLITGTFGGKDYVATDSTLDTAVGVIKIDVGNVSVLGGSTLTITGTGASTIALVDTAGNSQTLVVDVATAIGDTVVLDFNAFGVKLTANKDVGTSWTSLDALDVEISTAAAQAVFQVGADNAADNRITVEIGDFQTTAIANGSALSVDLTTVEGAQAALDDLNTAIDYVSNRRGAIGAYVNQLNYVAGNLATMIENKQAAESVIRDVDMALEMTSFTKYQILLQAGTAMLAQANMAPQQVLALFG